MTEVNVLLLQAHGMMSHPKWFKIGGFRLRDFRAALEIEEQTPCHGESASSAAAQPVTGRV